MKSKLHYVILALSLCSACFAADKIVTATGADLSGVQKMLDVGWTVRASHAVITETTVHGNHSIQHILHVFTLSPPEDLAEQEAKLAAEKKAAFALRRAEWLREQRNSGKP